MIDQKKVEALSLNETFVALLDDILGQRESFIRALHGSSNEQIQQISGRILMCDEILDVAGYRQIQERRKR